MVDRQIFDLFYGGSNLEYVFTSRAKILGVK